MAPALIAGMLFSPDIVSALAVICARAVACAPPLASAAAALASISTPPFTPPFALHLTLAQTLAVLVSEQSLFGGAGLADRLLGWLDHPALIGDARLLAIALLADAVLGDPVYPLHPVRLIGRTLTGFEAALRRLGADGYGGGIALFVLLALLWVGGLSAALVWAAAASPWLALALHGFLLYSLLALGDLVRHVWRVERAAACGDLPAAREAIAHLVGRDTAPMDAAACRRAAIESLSENLTDGFTSALFWYLLAGLPGLVLFKIVSTMDSMVGYKTPRYLRFGWCGARLDDVMNYLPARLTWLLLALVASVVPGCSGRKALRVGYRQHGVLPGPNSGWSEAATAGGIARRLVGPIWMRGQLVTEVWIGEPADPPAATHADVVRAVTLVALTGLAAALLTGWALVSAAAM